MTADQERSDPGESRHEDNLSEALISMGNLRHNLDCIRSITGPHCRVMGIVKANAYGHGAPQVTAVLEEKGVRDFGVANIHEAIELKKAHPMHKESRLVAFAAPLPQHIRLYLQHGVEMTVCDQATILAADSVASTVGSTLRVQLKVDTGMGRLGVTCNEAAQLLETIDRSPNLELAGIYTHFAESHEPDGFTAHQLEQFLQVTGDYESSTGKTILKHAANSSAVVLKPDARLDMVRPGIMLYGCHPVDDAPMQIPVKPVMQFQTRVIFVKEVPAGTTISYNRTWAAPGPRRIATLSVGYADGFHRTLSNRAKVYVNGRLFDQVGTVTMDQMMIDLGNNQEVKPGDTAVLFGWQGPTAGQQAIHAGTISYELLCSVSRRVKRIYV